MMNDSTNDHCDSLPPNDMMFVPVSRNAASLVASLNGAFSCKTTFSISNRKLDRQNTPELVKIKERIKTIPRTEFQTLCEVGQHVQQSKLRVDEFRRKSIINRAVFENQPRVEQANEVEKITRWIAEERNKFGIGGEQPIKRHVSRIDEHIVSVQEESNNVQLKLSAIHILRDKTEYREGFWNAIKDKLLPGATSVAEKSLSGPIAALATWVADLIVSGVVYDRSWERRKFLEALDTWEVMLTGVQKMILDTNSDLTKYNAPVNGAYGHWANEVGVIWLTRPLETPIQTDYIIQYDNHLKTLEVAGTMLSLSFQPFEEVVRLMYPFYGAGISVDRNAKDLSDDVPNALGYLRKLLTAKEIIRNSQQEEFQGKVYCLARLIYGHLEYIDELCAQWSISIDPGELARFIEKETANFIRETDRVIQAVKDMLETHVCDSKVGHAIKKRTKWDRLWKNWDWNNRPLVTSAGALEVFGDLEAVIGVIYRFSVSMATGTNMSAMEGLVEARRSYVEFNRSNALLEKVFKVLMEEIQRGSMVFAEKKRKKHPERKHPAEVGAGYGGSKN